MNKALPKIKETAEEIRELLKSETQVKRQNRLQALYLVQRAINTQLVSNMLNMPKMPYLLANSLLNCNRN